MAGELSRGSAGIQFGICNEIFEGWELERAFSYAAGVGYEWIEIAPFTLAPRVTDLSSADRERIVAIAARAGIGIIGLHWILAKTEGLHLTAPDWSARKRARRYLVELVDCCADLGGTRIVLGSPKQRDLAPGISEEQGWAWAGETLRDAVRQAEERGVVICFEPLSPTETNFINTAAAARRFAAQFASPAMSVILDVKAMSSESLSIPAIIGESAGTFAHFHANDANLKGPGFGEVDYRPIANALQSAHYNGVVSVEVFDFADGPEVIATRSLEYLQRVFAAT